MRHDSTRRGGKVPLSNTKSKRFPRPARVLIWAKQHLGRPWGWIHFSPLEPLYRPSANARYLTARDGSREKDPVYINVKDLQKSLMVDLLWHSPYIEHHIKTSHWYKNADEPKGDLDHLSENHFQFIWISLKFGLLALQFVHGVCDFWHEYIPSAIFEETKAR